MKMLIKKLTFPIYALFIRPLNARNLKNFYYSVFKYQSFKLFICNDFTTKNDQGTQLQYFWKKKLNFPHPIGIVIGRGVTFGNNCQVFQNCTIGGGKGGYPKIGNNVTIYPNSIIIGGISIGDNSIVGANSFINKNVPKNSTVIGINQISNTK
jgi:serine O-acetyltransferase